MRRRRLRPPTSRYLRGVTDRRVVARVPDEIAAELLAAGTSARLPQVRATDEIAAAIVLAGVQVSTTLITLAQGPMTARDLASMIFRWRRRRRTDSRQITITVSGPNGRITVELDTLNGPDDLAQMLALAIDMSES